MTECHSQASPAEAPGGPLRVVAFLACAGDSVPMFARAKALAFIIGFLAVLSAACGGDDFSSDQLPPCNQDPWTCGAAQTCWVDATGANFACLNQGAGGPGASCELLRG